MAGRWGRRRRPNGGIRAPALAVAWLLLAAPPGDAQGLVDQPAPASPEPALASPSSATQAGASPMIPPTALDEIERAWRRPAGSLQERVLRTRRAALERGVWSLEPAALSLLGAPGDPVAAANAAIALAPDLPAGHAALARAHWRAGAPIAAFWAVARGLSACATHPSAWLWLRGSALFVLAVALMAGGALCLVLAGLAAAPHAAHDLGDALARPAPAFARAGLLAALILLPAAAGEGLLGVALALLALGMLYGHARQRAVLALASLALWAGAFPLASAAGAALNALERDPVARSALRVARGVPLRADAERLSLAAPDDALAARALAQLSRRAAGLARSDAHYQRLLARLPGDPTVANNAANVRLQLGHVQAALELYEAALAGEPSAAVLFNLSQAQGRAFQVEELTRTLSEAQAREPELVAELTQLQSVYARDFVVDLPGAGPELHQRLARAGDGAELAAWLRAGIAPGRLGAEPGGLLGAVLAVTAVGWIAGRRLRPSRWCPRCGRRVCPRCPKLHGRGEQCERCHHLFESREKGERALRAARIAALDRRRSRLERLADLLSLLVPGAAGPLARRPLLGLLGAWLFALALAAHHWRAGVVPDPLILGDAAPLLAMAVVAVAACAYAIVVSVAMAARRSA